MMTGLGENWEAVLLLKPNLCFPLDCSSLTSLFKLFEYGLL